MSSARTGDFFGMKQDSGDRCTLLASGLPLLYASIVGQSHEFSSPLLDNDSWWFENLNAWNRLTYKLLNEVTWGSSNWRDYQRKLISQSGIAFAHRRVTFGYSSFDR